MLTSLFRRMGRSATAGIMLIALLLGSLFTLVLAHYGSAQTNSTIVIDGSSTVYPLTDSAIRRYRRNNRQAAEIKLNFSGTRAGFRKFCEGETDIQNASRPIIREEMALCELNGIEYIEIPVAMDAISIVAHPNNAWANDITLQELKKIWEPAAEGQITRWSQVRSGWPDRPLNLYGRGQDSGTYDYFTQVVVGEAGSSRIDYVASEDLEFLVEEISNDPDALGFFDIGNYLRHWEDLKPIPLDSGRGPIFPKLETIRSLEYRPLSRPLLLYINTDSLAEKPQIGDFIEAYLSEPERWIPLVRFLPLSGRAYEMARNHFRRQQTGTAFQGQPLVTITVEEALGSGG
ncbi:MAG: PstS family phosphate ABC transporter substrate-binding protein [Thermostichus sp. HHBFW_bins_43]